MKLKLMAAVALASLCGAPAYFAFQGGKQDPHKDHGHEKGGKGGNVKDRIPDYYKSEAEARPFPPTLDPAQFSQAAVQKAYRAAREIPGVLAQQPCYCYCDRMGHKGLLACHRDNHSAG
jgi:hypothetical protein